MLVAASLEVKNQHYLSLIVGFLNGVPQTITKILNYVFHASVEVFLCRAMMLHVARNTVFHLL